MVEIVDDSERVRKREEHINVISGLAKEVFGRGVASHHGLGTIFVYKNRLLGSRDIPVALEYYKLSNRCEVRVNDAEFYDRALKLAELCEANFSGLEVTLKKEYSSD